MREGLKELADQIILAGRGIAPLIEKGVAIQHFRVENDVVYVALVRGIETVANTYGFKSVNIEDGVVRIEEDGVCFYQYVLERDREKVFGELLLGGKKSD